MIWEVYNITKLMSTLGIHNRWGKGNNHNILCDHEPVLALHGLQVIKSYLRFWNPSKSRDIGKITQV